MLSAEGLNENARMNLYLDGKRLIDGDGVWIYVLRAILRINNVLLNCYCFTCIYTKSFLVCICSYSEFYMKDVYWKNEK
jgi:hypothetical protein